MLTDSSLTQHLRMHALPNFFPKYYFYLSECLYVCLPAVLLHSQPFHYACLQRQSSPLDWCLYFPLYSLFARYHFPSPRYPSLLSYLTVGPSIRGSYFQFPSLTLHVLLLLYTCLHAFPASLCLCLSLSLFRSPTVVAYLLVSMSLMCV